MPLKSFYQISMNAKSTITSVWIRNAAITRSAHTHVFVSRAVVPVIHSMRKQETVMVITAIFFFINLLLDLKLKVNVNSLLIFFIK